MPAALKQSFDQSCAGAFGRILFILGELVINENICGYSWGENKERQSLSTMGLINRACRQKNEREILEQKKVN